MLKRSALRPLLLLTGALITLSACAPTLPKAEAPGHVDASEASRLVAECLEGAGWSARVDPDGSVNVSVPKGQEDKYEEAASMCWSKIDAPTFDDLTQADRRAYYERFLSLRQCIIDFGVEIPEAPTFQTWVEMDGTWSPYTDVGLEVMKDQGKELLATCPQVMY